jgi:hypothetical protein
MTAAATAMGKAVASLTALNTRDAVAPEMDALTMLLKAQATVKRREVTRQQAGSGAGETNRNYDLSSLFDRELKRTQETNYENSSKPAPAREEKTASMLARIRELARRQDEIVKRQQELARNRGALGDEAAKRELEKLVRDQMDLRRRVEELSAQTGQSGGSGSGTGALGDMRAEARQLAEAQRRIASELSAIGPGEKGRDAARRLAGEQERLADRARTLEQGLKASDSGAGRPGGAGDAAREIERQRLVERMRKSATDMRAAASRPDFGRDSSPGSGPGSGSSPGRGSSSAPQGRPSPEDQRAIARALDRTADSLASSVGMGEGASRQAGVGTTPMGQGIALSAPGTQAFKQDFSQWEQMRQQVTIALGQAEASLSKKPGATGERGGERGQAHAQKGDRLAAGVGDVAPPGYQQQVDTYFRAIAGTRK